MFFCCCNPEPEIGVSVAVKTVAATSEEAWVAAGLDAAFVAHDADGQPLVPLPRPDEEVDKLDMPVSFFVTVEKQSLKAPLGVHVDLLDEALLFVCTVLTGAAGSGATAIEAYNRGAPEGRVIQQGDYIKQVNGIEGAMQMREALKNSTKLELQVQRPFLFQRSILKQKDDSMGLDLNFGPNACSLLITNVKPDGVVAKSAPDVRSGDRIISVNGTSGNTEELLRAIQSSENPVLGLSRPPGE